MKKPKERKGNRETDKGTTTYSLCTRWFLSSLDMLWCHSLVPFTGLAVTEPKPLGSCAGWFGMFSHSGIDCKEV